MEIILLQEVDKLGGPGQVVRVANGYGRNYLIPKKLAVPATSGNLKMLGQKRAKLLRLDAKNKGDAEKLAAMLGELTVSVLKGEERGDPGQSGTRRQHMFQTAMLRFNRLRGSFDRASASSAA